jgi:hypothetical protein
MADFTTLSVTDKVGIGTENPIAQLHISSSTAAPSQAFLESGGALLKLSVDTSGAKLGTDNAFSLSILTDGSPRMTIDPAGNVGIGTTPTIAEKLTVNGNIKSISFLGNGATLDGIVKKAGDTMTGSLTVQNNLTVTGNVGIGTNEPQGKLDVRGDIRAGNSDIYLTKTDHNYTGIGNTAGFAAIENAVNYDALMILGRAGTSKGRSVKLWDYLQVNGDLEVTGNVGIGTNSPDRKLVVRGGETSLQQEGWQTPTFQNGWHNYSTEYNYAAYFKDSLGVIHLRGLVRNGIGTIFTLPEGYRPPRRELFRVATYLDVMGRIDIFSDGQVYMVSGNSGWISLDGITFKAPS